MKKLLILATIAALLLMTTSNRSKAAVSVPVGVIIICVIVVVNGVVAVGNDTDPSNDAQNVSGNGNAQFQSVATQQEPVASTQFQPVSLNFSGNDPVYGTFNFQFDPSRPPQNTVVTSNQPGADFPATADVYANCVGTVSGLPGTYENNTPVHLHTSNLQSFDPQNNERYTVSEDVTFTDPNNPFATPFTITAGSVVTLS